MPVHPMRNGLERRASAKALRFDRRGAIAVTTAFILLPLIAVTGLVVDAGFWIIGSTRLQIAADAAAMGDAFALVTSTFQGQTSTQQASSLSTIAMYEANAAATKLVGTLTTTPSITYDSATYSYVTVTLTSRAPNFFGQVINVSAPLLRAVSTASFPAPPTCMLALGTSGTAIKVDNSGSIIDSKCAVFSNSTGNPSIYLNSGTISGTTIGAAGTIVQSNSGSNSMTPANPNQNQPKQADPKATKTAPTPGTCATNVPTYTNYGTYNITPTTWCQSMTFGGNGSTDTFAAGIYYIVNGDLTFNNASATFASGVTFVMTGSTPGNFSWVNNSNSTPSLVAPTSGSTAGVAIWQVCNSSGNQTASFQQGGTLQVSGSIYMPCAYVQVYNNMQISAVSGAEFDMTVSSIYVYGSAGVHTNNPSTSGGSVGSPVLSQ